MSNLIFLQVMSPTSVIKDFLTLCYYILTKPLISPYLKRKQI